MKKSIKAVVIEGVKVVKQDNKKRVLILPVGMDANELQRWKQTALSSGDFSKSSPYSDKKL